jgi:hypothetical protein
MYQKANRLTRIDGETLAVDVSTPRHPGTMVISERDWNTIRKLTANRVCATASGAVVSIGNHQHPVHRLIYPHHGVGVVHADSNPLNNLQSNLRHTFHGHAARERAAGTNRNRRAGRGDLT